jgi:hypothetical protein
MPTLMRESHFWALSLRETPNNFLIEAYQGGNQINQIVTILCQ